MKILVTGCAGFIGFNLIKDISKNKKNLIIGIDNINNYYSVALKKKRLSILNKSNNFKFQKIDFSKLNILNKLFKKNKFDIIIHLGAQAGVRYSISNPEKYFDSNLSGFFNILDLSKKYKIKHLIFASTSSVYGDTEKFPLKEDFDTSKPLSFYAATKKANEVMAHSYSYLHNIPITALRFFTVYGPFGRPDMSLYKFTEAINDNKKIDLYNNGKHIRDFTYVGDVVNYIKRIITKPKKSKIPFQILNVSSNNPVPLKSFVNLIEKKLNRKAKINFKNLQQGDVKKTHGDNSKINTITKFKPETSLEEGVNKFIDWYINKNKK